MLTEPPIGERGQRSIYLILFTYLFFTTIYLFILLWPWACLRHRWDMLTELPSGERGQRSIYLFLFTYLFFTTFYLFILVWSWASLGHRWDMLTELPSGERGQKIYLFTTIYLFILYYYLFIYSSLDLGLSWTPLGHIDRTTNRRKEVKGKVPVLDQFDLFPLFQKYFWQL